MAEVSGGRALRPFPALDPEPPRRLTWRSLRWPAVACLAAAAVAAAFLIWPSSSQSASRPARAPFADRDGLVVFEQQPSGMLGTAAPDGSHLVTLRQVGALQGNDLPVAAADGRYLVNLEGQLVTMGPAGPTSVSDLAGSAGQDATDQGSSLRLGGCHRSPTAAGTWSRPRVTWPARRASPGSRTSSRPLAGRDTCSARSPTPSATRAPPRPSCPGRSARRRHRLHVECFGPETAAGQGRRACAGRAHGHRTIVTAAELKGALGWPSAMPVQLYRGSGPRREQAGAARRRRTPRRDASHRGRPSS